MDSVKKIVITGVSRGIGFHLSRRFLAEGFSVIGISRSRTDAIKNSHFEHFEVDLTDLKKVASLALELRSQPIHGLIHNAGIHGPIGPFEENSVLNWVNTFYVNLFGAVALTQPLVPVLRKNKGFIIFLSGGGSAFAKANFSAYGASKTAVVRLAENLAEEFYPDIRVYCMAPGVNRTGLLQDAIQAGEKIPEEKIVDFNMPEKLCLFLAKNRDLRYSGKWIHVKDDYLHWEEKHFEKDAYTLRRVDA